MQVDICLLEMDASSRKTMGPKLNLQKRQFQKPEQGITKRKSVVSEDSSEQNSLYIESVKIEVITVKPPGIIQLPFQTQVEQIMQDYDKYGKLEDKWILRKSEKDFKTYSRASDIQYLYITRGDIQIQRSPETVLQFFLDDSQISLYLPKVKSVETLDCYSETRSLKHLVLIAPIAFYNRDFVYVQDVLRRDGIIYFVQKSIESEQKPQQDKLVRASLYFFIVRLEPILPKNFTGKGEINCKLTMIELRDLGGNLPNVVKKIIANARGKLVKPIQQKIEKLK